MNDRDSRHILIIERETALSQLMHEALSALGFRVTACSDGEEGFRMAAKAQPDLIIMGLLPDGRLKGEDIYRMLRDRPDTAPIPIIVCSVHGVVSIRRRLDERPLYTLAKPFTVAELFAMVRAALQDDQVQALFQVRLREQQPGWVRP